MLLLLGWSHEEKEDSFLRWSGNAAGDGGLVRVDMMLGGLDDCGGDGHAAAQIGGSDISTVDRNVGV